MRCAAVIYVSQLDRMEAFYQECFDLEVVDTAPGDYTVLESQAWTLSLVTAPADIRRSVVVSDPPRRRESTPIKLVFDVTSITAHRETVVGRGGRMDESEWVFRGYRHCDFVDPEGNVGQLRESVQLSV